ncbi:hypothetical protein F4810DRAFT_263795 [Camillea tinctor]|nr:hypothetical protein F4810DRAFT_263795 [Camillea tinctor]
MGILQHALRLTGANLRSPFLRTALPSLATAYAIQAAVAVPSIRAKTEHYYDASGSVTFLAVTLVSLGLRGGGWGWRHIALSAAAVVWSLRLGSYLYTRIAASDGRDSRFDGIRAHPAKFAAAFAAQATWVSLVLMPVVAVNAVPAVGLRATDVLGGAVFLAGFACEVVADRQKSAWLDGKKRKLHDEEFMTSGLWSRSQFPNYFGEITLWTGIATVAAGALVSPAAQAALGVSGVGGKLLALGLSYVSPAFTAFLLLKVSGVPLSEKKYDDRYGDREDYREWKRNTPKLFPKLF